MGSEPASSSSEEEMDSDYEKMFPPLPVPRSGHQLPQHHLEQHQEQHHRLQLQQRVVRKKTSSSSSVSSSSSSSVAPIKKKKKKTAAEVSKSSKAMRKMHVRKKVQPKAA